MVCDPSSNSLNPPIFPPIGNPFGTPISPFQIPLPNITIPTGLIQDLLDLLNSLGALFPSGLFKPNIDEFTKTILDAIASLFNQIAPFLSLYNFIMALFNLILCIIEVLCAIPNPFAIAAAMVKLFSECLPPFLNLFPFLALIAMIIALLLLILALITYIIAAIIAFIEQIIANLLILADGITLQDAEATLAAINKIADLMCLIQNLMAIFVALAAIMAVIQALSLFAGAPVCDDGAPCCQPTTCPPFIKDGPITGTQGKLKYYKQVGPDLDSIFENPDLLDLFPPDFDPAVLFARVPPVREERWQFVDTNVDANHFFSEIITPFVDFSQFPPVIATFWPDGTTFDGYSDARKMPYNVDLRIRLNPAQFISSDTGGTRWMRIKGCGTVRKPYIGLLDFQELPDISSLSDPTLLNGTLNLVGGAVFEDDGTTKYLLSDGYQASLDTFIHKPNALQTAPASAEDGITFDDIEFTFTPNYGVLMQYFLISVGCLPDVAIEKTLFNTKLVSEDIRAVVQKLRPAPAGVKVPSTGILPNVSGAQDCVLAALAEFKANVSIETAAVFQAAITTCLGDLQDQTLAVYCGAVQAAVSQFKSTVAIDTNVQFTSREIDVTVVLKDAGGTNIILNMPDSCQGTIGDLLKGVATLGTISKFTYNPAGAFDAKLSSKAPGSGVLTIEFDNKVFSTVVPRVPSTSTTPAIPTTIVETELAYTFVDAVPEPAVRRDDADVAGE